MKKWIIVLLASAFIFPACGPQKRTTRQSKRSNIQQSRFDRQRGNSTTIQKGTQPDWVTGDSVRYPNISYVKAVGFGKNRQEAEQDAKGNMSEIFDSKIKATTQTFKQARVKHVNRKLVSSQIDTAIDSKIKVSTESIFKGMFLSEYWQNKKGTVFVLATIKRSQVMPALRSSMKDLDGIIATLVTEANATNDKLTKIQKLYSAFRKSVLREYYNTQYAVLDHNGRKFDTEYTTFKLANMAKNGLKDLAVYVKLEGAGSNNVKSAIINAAANEGLRVNNGEQPSAEADDFESFESDENSHKKNFGAGGDLLLDGKVSFQPVTRGDGEYKYYQGKVRINVINPSTKKTYHSFVITALKGRLTDADAKRFAAKALYKKISKKLAKELKKVLSNKKS